jgi:glucuronoarabinoxylan endo-1,4-beta-xylanase
MSELKLKRKWAKLDIFKLAVLFTLSSCGGGDSDPKPVVVTEPQPTTITINTAATHQQMVGFGGALTWYSDRVISSSKKTEISNLIFNDLGADIIRLKNWYYPDNYPAATSTDAMSDDNAKASWDVTNQLYTLAKAQNSDVKILLSSWGPPAGLKSNNSSREGTLLKDTNGFMYDAYADYWVNILDHLPFTPDYISIQNEPTFINSGWTTCQWSSSETTSLPDYNIAFDKVHDKIKDRASVPIMIGPESQDIPTFSAFANVLKNKDYCGMLAYHSYNINSGATSDQIKSSLQTIGSFNTKPNIMTEFSDNLSSWFSTAQFIQNTLLYANSSGYIYWKLVWGTPASGTDAGMVSINAAGQYIVTPFYYLIKHFSKHIDAGYTRVEASSSNTNLSVSSFISPDSKKLTVIIINKGTSQVEVKFGATGKTITSVSADQSSGTTYYKAVQNTSVTDPLIIPATSITTVVLDI